MLHDTYVVPILGDQLHGRFDQIVKRHETFVRVDARSRPELSGDWGEMFLHASRLTVPVSFSPS